MTQLIFPPNPVNNQLYPEQTVEGLPQFRWNSSNLTWVKLNNTNFASETNAGIAEIATQDEVNAGSDNTRIVTPAKLTTFINTSSVFSERVIAINGSNSSSMTLLVNSNSSHSITTGTKVFTYTSSNSVAFFVGQRLRAVYNTSNYLEGLVTNITSSNITINVDYTKGSGTYPSWTLGVTGERSSFQEFINDNYSTSLPTAWTSVNIFLDGNDVKWDRVLIRDAFNAIVGQTFNLDLSASGIQYDNRGLGGDYVGIFDLFIGRRVTVFAIDRSFNGLLEERALESNYFEGTITSISSGSFGDSSPPFSVNILVDYTSPDYELYGPDSGGVLSNDVFILMPTVNGYTKDRNTTNYSLKTGSNEQLTLNSINSSGSYLGISNSDLSRMQLIINIVNSSDEVTTELSYNLFEELTPGVFTLKTTITPNLSINSNEKIWLSTRHVFLNTLLNISIVASYTRVTNN